MAEKPMHDGNVAPGLHAGRDEIDRLGVVFAQELERTVGEHHAETPGGPRRVLLEQMHLVARMPALPQVGKVEPGRAAADHCQTQGRSPMQPRGA
jgi:hypothetical protein